MLRALVCWPAPRLDRIHKALANEALYEEMDGLSYLPQFGVQVTVMDSSKGWRNPFAKRGSLLAGIDPLRFLRQLWHYKTFDVLVSADSSACFLFVCAKRLFGLKKPVLVIDPALDPNYINRMRLHSMVLPYVQGVIVFGQVQVDFLEREYNGRVKATFIRHRMDCRFFDPLKCPPPPEHNRYIVSVGNDRGRDFETLISAVKDLPIKLILHTRRKLKLPLPPNVQVQSHWISFEELRELYGAAQIIVVPLFETIHASGTNGLLEALAMGRPVIVSASSGIIDYVEHQNNACVVPTGNVQALRNAVTDLLENLEGANTLGQQARLYAEQRLAMPVYAQLVSEVIQKATFDIDSNPTHNTHE